MPKISYAILFSLFITLLFGATLVHANGDQPDDHHDEVPITEQKREAGNGNVAVVLGSIAVVILGGLA